MKGLFVFLFGVATLLLTLTLARKARSIESGELSTYMTLFAWVSFIFGLFIALA